MRNPFFNKIPKQKVIQRKKAEPELSEWEVYFIQRELIEI